MKEKRERNKSIRKWRKRGYSYRDIGTVFNRSGVPLSRQRIHQICSKEQPGIWRLLWGIFKKLIR